MPQCLFSALVLRSAPEPCRQQPPVAPPTCHPMLFCVAHARRSTRRVAHCTRGVQGRRKGCGGHWWLINGPAVGPSPYWCPPRAPMMVVSSQPSSRCMKGSQTACLARSGSGMLRSTASTAGGLWRRCCSHPYQLLGAQGVKHNSTEHPGNALVAPLRSACGRAMAAQQASTTCAALLQCRCRVQ